MLGFDPIEVAILLYPGVQMAVVLGLSDLLNFADDLGRKKAGSPDNPALHVTHWQRDEEGELYRTFGAAPGVSGKPTVAVVPPAWGDPISRAAAQPYAQWLRERHASGTVLSSVCSGAFILAETGLLADRPLTTHWTYEEVIRERFPDVRIDTARLLIDDTDILTAGGIMSWTDLGLRLIDRYLGTTFMAETARAFLVDPPGREQRYYSIFVPRLNHGDTAILKAQQWLHATDAKNASLAVLATQSQLEERTFLRRFQKATGMTSTEYIQRLRVGRARELLQFGNISVEQAAWEVGYADTTSFRKVFIRIVGLRPSEYRRRFRLGD